MLEYARLPIVFNPREDGIKEFARKYKWTMREKPDLDLDEVIRKVLPSETLV